MGILRVPAGSPVIALATARIRARLRRLSAELDLPLVSPRPLALGALACWAASTMLAAVGGVIVSGLRDAGARDAALVVGVVAMAVSPFVGGRLSYDRGVSVLAEPMSAALRRTPGGSRCVLIAAVLLPSLLSVLVHESLPAAFTVACAAPGPGAAVAWMLAAMAWAVVVALTRHCALLGAFALASVALPRPRLLALALLARAAVAMAGGFAIARIVAGAVERPSAWSGHAGAVHRIAASPGWAVAALAALSLVGAALAALTAGRGIGEDAFDEHRPRRRRAPVAADLTVIPNGRRVLALLPLLKVARSPLVVTSRLGADLSRVLVVAGLALGIAASLRGGDQDRSAVALRAIANLGLVYFVTELLSAAVAVFVSPDAEGPASWMFTRTRRAWRRLLVARATLYGALVGGVTVAVVTGLALLPAARVISVTSLYAVTPLVVALGAFDHVGLPGIFPRFDWENIAEIGNHPKASRIGTAVTMALSAPVVGALVAVQQELAPHLDGAGAPAVVAEAAGSLAAAVLASRWIVSLAARRRDLTWS